MSKVKFQKPQKKDKNQPITFGEQTQIIERWWTELKKTYLAQLYSDAKKIEDPKEHKRALAAINPDLNVIVDIPMETI